jgi:hypothetical protein
MPEFSYERKDGSLIITHENASGSYWERNQGDLSQSGKVEKADKVFSL